MQQKYSFVLYQQLANEFFQNEQIDRAHVSSPFQQPSPMHLDSFQLPAKDWTREFTSGNNAHLSQPSSPMPNTHEEFEQIYQRHSSRSPPVHSKWTEDFSSMQRSSTPSSDEEQLAFQRAFEQVDDGTQHHRDWDKEFADHETWEATTTTNNSQATRQQPVRPARPIPRSSSQMLDVKDWSEEFSKYHDLTPQQMKSISKSI